MTIPKAPRRKVFYQDSAELLYGNATAGILVTIFASSLLVFAFNTPGIQHQKYIWWLSISLIMLLRFVDTYRWHKSEKNQSDNGRKSVYRFISGSIITALMWCFYCLYVFRSATSTELACMIIVVSALAGGASTVLAAHKKTAMSYAFIMLGPFSLGLLLSTEQYKQTLGLLGLAFSAVMILTAKKSAEFTANAILLKNENAELVNEMEQKVAQRTEEIYQLSNVDPLTGLFNRSAFMLHLHKQLVLADKNSIPVALLFIDLDGFKNVNDTLGHETGDKVLEQTARRLETFKDEKHLLCRWGGDEFLIAFIGADYDLAVNHANKVIEEVSKYYDFENNRLSIGATIGIALYPTHTQKCDELIQLADTAMYYQKKSQPRSVGLFNIEMGQRLYRQQKLKIGLAEAIDKQQFRMVYQPIIQSSSQQIVSFEALLRWNFDGENVPPDEFITIAEQYGLINLIGNWVLQQSCIAAAQWFSFCPHNPPSVSVNVSVLQLHNPNFIGFVESTLKASQLSAKNLTIEITESIFASDKEKIFSHIKALQTMGVEVSIDDFGTEYSSLSVIQDLAANTIKIDRSFVNKLNTSGLAIIEAVKKMASTLNYSVIAEGIETQQQADILTELGIEMLQGYYFSKPLELKDVKKHVLQKNKNHTDFNLS